MKKVFLIITFAFFAIGVKAQERFVTEDLIGYWEPNKHATQLIIWKDVNNNFQMIEFSTISGIPLRLLSMKIKDTGLIVKTIFDEKRWVTESTYTFVNKNTLQCAVKGPINDIITYTKIK